MSRNNNNKRTLVATDWILILFVLAIILILLAVFIHYSFRSTRWDDFNTHHPLPPYYIEETDHAVTMSTPVFLSDQTSSMPPEDGATDPVTTLKERDSN